MKKMCGGGCALPGNLKRCRTGPLMTKLSETNLKSAVTASSLIGP